MVEKKNFSQGTLIKFQQILVCLAIIVLFAKLDRSSLPFRVLFDHRPFLIDFFTINAIFTVLAVYHRTLKFFLLQGRNQIRMSAAMKSGTFLNTLGSRTIMIGPYLHQI